MIYTLCKGKLDFCRSVATVKWVLSYLFIHNRPAGDITVAKGNDITPNC